MASRPGQAVAAPSGASGSSSSARTGASAAPIDAPTRRARAGASSWSSVASTARATAALTASPENVDPRRGSKAATYRVRSISRARLPPSSSARCSQTRVRLEALHRDWLAGDGIAQALQTLDARSRRIVEERWLKVNDDASGGMTLHELAAEYGVSAERIRQIEVAALKKMRKALM